MTNFDGTVDNRWRPDLASSQRRVREEEQEQALEDMEEIVVHSRELSFVPARRKEFRPHDDQTAALIRRSIELERLPHGQAVKELIEKWTWIDRMQAAEQKQRFLEPVIERVRRAPRDNEHLLVFLMLVFEPVRRSVGRQFERVQSGLFPQARDVSWSNRAEARMIRDIDREQMRDVTREGAIEAVFRYPSPPRSTSSPGCGRSSLTAHLTSSRASSPRSASTASASWKASVCSARSPGSNTPRARRPAIAAGCGSGGRRWTCAMCSAWSPSSSTTTPSHRRCARSAGCAPAGGHRGHYFDETPVADLASRRRVSPSTVQPEEQGRRSAGPTTRSSLRCVRSGRSAMRPAPSRSPPPGRPAARRAAHRLIDDKAA